MLDAQTGKFRGAVSCGEPDTIQIAVAPKVLLVLDKVTRNSITSDILSDIISTKYISKANAMNCNP
jgi:hypothetical protein